MPLLTDLITAAVFIPINALILWITLKLFKIKSKYLEALKVTAIAGVVLFIVNYGLGLALGGAMNAQAGLGALAGLGMLMFLIILIVSVALYTYLIKTFLKQDTKKALLITVVYWVISFVVTMIVGAIIAAIFLAAVIGSGAAGY